ncbi:MAG: response regulator [Euzebya sp.]
MSSPGTIRVLIVDDHAVVRTGLAQLIDGWPDIELVGTAADGAQGVEQAHELQPDVVLMDLAMPVMDGIQATTAIRAATPATRVVVLTSMGAREQITQALDAGADGYLFKHAEPEEIARAIRTAVQGGAVLDPKAARAMLDHRSGATPQSHPLSQRETEVLRLVAQGLANKQIARRLGIAERTVKAHLTNVFARLGVSDRTQAALWAQANLDE